MKQTILIFLSISLITFLNSCSNSNIDPIVQPTNYQGIWNGTYSGDDSGTWTATVDDKGVATGSATSAVYSATYNLNGTVNLKNGQFSATIGEVSTGTKFSGQFTVSSTATIGSGTWTNESLNMTGVWEGSMKK